MSGPAGQIHEKMRTVVANTEDDCVGGIVVLRRSDELCATRFRGNRHVEVRTGLIAESAAVISFITLQQLGIQIDGVAALEISPLFLLRRSENRKTMDDIDLRLR